MTARLLDLFCCEGGAGKGYADAGFEVVGVDIKPQPRYPYEFVQGDAFLMMESLGILADFDAVHASPPCQDHGISGNIRRREMHGTGWMLPRTLEILRDCGLPYIVENVNHAHMGSAVTLCGTVFGLGLHRHRRFETSFACLSPGCDRSQVRYRGRDAEIFGHHGNTDRIRDEWGVPWMSQYGIAQSIPPAFTRWLGELLMAELEAKAVA